MTPPILAICSGCSWSWNSGTEFMLREARAENYPVPNLGRAGGALGTLEPTPRQELERHHILDLAMVRCVVEKLRHISFSFCAGRVGGQPLAWGCAIVDP